MGKPMRVTAWCTVLILTVLVVFGRSLEGAVPYLINYQGFLTDANRDTVRSGTYRMGFAIYSDSTGGARLWNEDYAAVSVSAGVFNVLLGSSSTLPAGIFSGTRLWLETIVEGAVLAPRRPLVTVPYSIQAQRADSARVAANVITDHGQLNGLSDDDHPQYHNDERGDARYFTQTRLQTSGQAGVHWNNLTNVPPDFADGVDNTGGVTDHGQLTGLGDDDHPQYYNNSRGDARYLQLTGGDLSGTRNPVLGVNGTGTGEGIRCVTTSSVGIPANASVHAENFGSDPGIYARSASGTSVHAVSAAAGAASWAVRVQNTSSNGNGTDVNVGSATALQVTNNSISSVPLDVFNKNSSSCNILRAFAGPGDDLRFRVSCTGNVTADGTFTGGGADFAELMPVEGERAGYEPGDVLEISPESGKAAKCGVAYSARVLGVVATKPGFLGVEGDLESKAHDHVEVAIVGIVPCKVTALNGEIRPGDLLATSGVLGYAMKASPDRLLPGMLLGKALEPLKGQAGVVKAVILAR